MRDRFFELLHARGEGVKLAVFFLGTSPAVDLAGAELLEELHQAMRERGIAFRLAEARGDVRETLRRAGFEEHYGPLLANQPVATVIEDWRMDAGRRFAEPGDKTMKLDKVVKRARMLARPYRVEDG